MKENHYGMVEGGDKKEKLVGACEGFVLYVIMGSLKKTTINALCYKNYQLIIDETFAEQWVIGK